MLLSWCQSVFSYFCVLQTTGTQVQVKIVKNKLAPPFKTVQFELEFGKGISRESEIIELALKHKLIKKSGSFYDCNGKKYHGKEAFKEFLAHNDDVQEELMMKLREKLLEGESGRELGDESTDGEPTQEIISPDSTDEEVAAAEA